MRLTNQTQLGLVILLEVALQPQELLSARVLAESAGISIKYTEQILRVLMEGGFLQSRRGVAGGYALSRPANQMGIQEILSALEGDLAVADLPSDLSQYNQARQVLFHLLWHPMEAAILSVAEKYTLDDLVQQYQKGIVADFQI